MGMDSAEDEAEALSTALQRSVGGSAKQKPPALTSTPSGVAKTLNSSMSSCGPSIASGYVDKLLRGYRKLDADSPADYTAALVHVFASYPESVVKALCDARSPDRLRLTHQFPPSEHEVAKACERKMAPMRARLEAVRKFEARQKARDEEMAREIPADERQRVGALMRKLAESMKASAASAGEGLANLSVKDVADPALKERVRAYHETKIAESIKFNQENPVRFSDDMLQRMGFGAGNHG